MGNRIIARITGEGFVSTIEEDDIRRVFFTGDADIDADGANGQHGKQPAYMVGNRGSEHLANGGMTIRGGKVVGNSSWFRDIVICGADGQPREFPGGVIASKTAYRFPDMAVDDPAAYVDSETVPYIVVPPIVRQATRGKVMGCRARATNLTNGKQSWGVVADIGPRTKTGEVSIEMARRLGIPHSPRTGGSSVPNVLYELWPGVPADGFALI
jgi:hypothetical protein